MKKRVRVLLPQWILRLYRSLRTVRRIIFKKVLDKRGQKLYLNLIQDRYPEILQWQNKGYVLDLGANLGHFSAAALSLGFKVIAVEPHPTAFEYLMKRFGGNSDVTLINKAVAREESNITLQLHPDHKHDPLITSLTASIIPEKFNNIHDTIEVHSITFSQIISMKDIFSIVKVDIEGAEIFIFDEIISEHRKIQNLLLETHTRFMLSEPNHESYTRGLNLLEEFIKKNSLQKKWHTNWV